MQTTQNNLKIYFPTYILISTLKTIIEVVRALPSLFRTKDIQNLQDFIEILNGIILNPKTADSLNTILSAFSTKGIAAGLKAAGTSLAQGAGALIKAHPVITSLIAAYGTLKLIDTFLFDADEKFEDASEAVSNYQATKSEIESINSELDTTKKQIDELNAKQSLSLVEQDELDKLTRTNDELERQLKIKETLENSQLNTARDEVNDFLSNGSIYNSDFNLFSPSTWGNSTQWSHYDPIYTDGGTTDDGVTYHRYGFNLNQLTPIQAIESHLRGLEALQEKITEFEKQAANSTDAKEVEKLQKQIDSKNSNLADETSWLNNAFQDISDITNNFDKSYFSDLEDYNRVMDSLNQFNDFLGISGSKTQSKLSGIFEIQELKDANTQQALVDYVDALKDVSEFDINSSSLNNVKGIERFRTALSEAGIEADDLYQYLKAIADDGSYDLDEVGKQLRESITNAILSSDKKADKEITQWVVDNWANDLSEDELTAVANIKANPEVDTSQWDIDTWRNQIQQYFNDNPVSIDVVLEDFNSKIDDIQSVYSTLANAVKEYNEYGAYTLDTLQSLLALEPEYLAMLVTENGQLGINKDTMMQLINTQIEDAKTKLYQAAARDINALSVSNESTNLQNNTEDLEDNTTATYENTVAKAAQNALSRGVSQEDIDEVWNRYSPLIDNLNSFQSNLQSNLSYALGGGSTASDASEKIADIQRQITELEESIALDELKYKFDSLEQSITKVDNALSLLNDISDLTYENDYIGKIELTTEQMDLAQSKAELLANEFKELQDEEYSSGDQAAELASRIFYAIIHSDMYENIYLNAGNS